MTVETAMPVKTATNSFTVTVLSEDSVSVICVDTDDNGEPIDQDDILSWPSDAEVSQVVGFPVRYWDAGDHPTMAESIFSAVR